MKLKNLLKKAKKINHKHIIAVMFVFIIIYVGTAGLPIIFNSLRTFLGADDLGSRASFVTFKTTLDDGFSDILDYRSGDPLRDKGFYVNLNGLSARLMGQHLMNRVIKLENGHLKDPHPALEDVSLPVARITSIFERHQMNGGDFLFVMTPHQVPKFEDIMPAGFHCYANESSDLLVDGLRANGVPVLDLRDEMKRDGLDHTESFFITDHHWLPETGFWAYTKIYEHFVSTGALEPIDPRYTDINEFYIDIFEDWFLGSSGVRTGRFFAGIDDFQIIHPKFETDFFVELPWINESMRGSFYEVLYDHSRNIRVFFTGFPYSAYLHTTYKIVRNDSASNNVTILSMQDSFGDSSIIYFPLMATTNHFLDLRHFHGDFEAKYYEIDPDILLFFVSPYNIRSPITQFNFLNE